MFCLFMAAYSIFYILPNLRPTWPPTHLPMLWIDRVVPLLPWTFLVYLSIYVFLTAIPLTIKQVETFNTLTRRMFLGLFISGLFFYFFPTTYPRPYYPETTNPLTNFFMWLVGTADKPNNCFPSLHVAGCCITTYTLRNKGKARAIMCFIWTTLICFSTLTTKQHYFIDILGGLSVTACVVGIDRFLVRGGYFKHLKHRYGRMLH